MSSFAKKSLIVFGMTQRVLLIMSCVWFLQACSIWSPDRNAYRKVQLLPPLRVPSGLTLPETNDTMAIPYLSLRQVAVDGLKIPEIRGRAIDAPPELLLDSKMPPGGP